MIFIFARLRAAECRNQPDSCYEVSHNFHSAVYSTSDQPQHLNLCLLSNTEPRIAKSL
ncbi:hypothetical protein BDV06DRAFT_198111 [Aspergillus oleicola]